MNGDKNSTKIPSFIPKRHDDFSLKIENKMHHVSTRPRKMILLVVNVKNTINTSLVKTIYANGYYFIILFFITFNLIHQLIFIEHIYFMHDILRIMPLIDQLFSPQHKHIILGKNLKKNIVFFIKQYFNGTGH